MGPLAGLTTADVEGFAERLLDALPLIRERDGGAFAARVREGIGWPELLGVLALELQRQAGSPAGSFRVVSEDSAAALVVVEYGEEELGMACVREAVELARRLLRGEDGDGERVLAGLRELYHRVRPGPTTRAVVDAARRRGIPVRRFVGETVVQLGLGSAQRRIHASMTSLTSVLATDVTSDKDRTKRALARIGLAVPDGGVAETLDEAMEIARRLGYPVLLKPLDANDGRGISGRLDGDGDVRAAYDAAAAEHPQVVVERYVEGRDHRIVVVDGRVVAVAERVPAHVVGDGRRTVRELVDEVNRDPRRDPHGSDQTLVRIDLDEITARFLARGGRTPDTVPAAGEVVRLRATANISTGGTSVDRTDEIHPRNAALCELAAGIVGLDVAGLDVLTPDISVPFDRNGAAIIEINASPGIRMHTDPTEGTPRDVPGAIVAMLFPPGSAATVPVVAVAGTRGAGAAARLVAHLLGAGGKRVGCAAEDGVRFRGLPLTRGPGPAAADVLLSHPQVDAAVLAADPGEILRCGLGFDACDVAIVLDARTGPPPDAGASDENVAEALGLVAATVSPGGHAVLDADDRLLPRLRDRARGSLVLTSAAGPAANPHVAEHVERGGTAVVLEARNRGGAVVILAGRGEAARIAVAPADELPAGVPIGGVLAAVAAAHALGMDAGEIREALRGFGG